MTEKGSAQVTEVLRAGSPVTRLDQTRAKLFVAQGPDKGKSVVIGPEPLVVGTEADCGLILIDRSVSRRHAEVCRRGEFVIVRDLGSTNGTFFHDARVGEVFVPLGGEIGFGKTKVKVVPEEVLVEPKPHVGDRLGPLIGADLRMREIFALIEDIAASDVTVVIEGETGTGKELVARAIHERSSRSSGPFVVFDCSNQPKDLVESALFGHVKGAFTGATSPRAGAFERANGGTIFLDELGEFGLDLQPKLLRVLESREVQKVGGDGYDAVDVRIIAATNRNLKGEVRAGRFREDLYYRLAVVKIVLPSLRERGSDIPRLVQHFIELSGSSFTVDPGCFDALRAHSWPGNVRELKNVVDRAAALSRGRREVDLSRFMLEHDDEPRPVTPLPSDKLLSFKEAKGKVISDFESQYILALLREHGNNISLAAREAGIDRKHFKDLMRKYGIEAKGSDEED
ncbi:MAG: sigma 54-dependent Fis family transcriptional regulator [Deltaproteobacteria bacterium]|nr:sigma 54-dependent Fis family transcriptional regulator [Deltaproteobacteria bacterium]